MKSKKYILGMMLATSLISACSKESSTVVVDKAPSSGKLVIEDGRYWEANETQVTPTISVSSKQLTNEGYEVAEQRMKETSLNSLNLPSSLNVNAFTLRSKSNIKTKDAVYIAPKLYLYRKSDKARVQVKQMGDQVLIPLHAILVDGFSKQIPSANGIDTVDLPQS